jgi:hypothetical protein
MGRPGYSFSISSPKCAISVYIIFGFFLWHKYHLFTSPILLIIGKNGLKPFTVLSFKKSFLYEQGLSKTDSLVQDLTNCGFQQIKWKKKLQKILLH